MRTWLPVGVGLLMIKWRVTVRCWAQSSRSLIPKGGRGWKHSWRTMSCRREVLSGAPAGATPRAFKDFMSAWLAKMKGPAANFNFLMTQRNHEQYIDRIWICNRQWSNPQQRIVNVDKKKTKNLLKFHFLGSPFRHTLYWEFYFKQLILEKPLRLAVGKKQYTFALGPWIPDKPLLLARTQTRVCMTMPYALGWENIPDKKNGHISPLRIFCQIPTFFYCILNLQPGKGIFKNNQCFLHS